MGYKWELRKPLRSHINSCDFPPQQTFNVESLEIMPSLKGSHPRIFDTESGTDKEGTPRDRQKREVLWCSPLIDGSEGSADCLLPGLLREFSLVLGCVLLA
jgi:hypothetical protein